MAELEESSKTAGIEGSCLDIDGVQEKALLWFSGRGLFHSEFIVCCIVLLPVIMAGVFCCTHGKDAIKPTFNIYTCSVLQFAMLYHFKGDLTLIWETASKPGIVLQEGEAFLLPVQWWHKPVPAFPVSASRGTSDCRSTLNCNSRCHFGEDVQRGEIFPCVSFFPFFLNYLNYILSWIILTKA